MSNFDSNVFIMLNKTSTGWVLQSRRSLYQSRRRSGAFLTEWSHRPPTTRRPAILKENLDLFEFHLPVILGSDFHEGQVGGHKPFVNSSERDLAVKRFGLLIESTFAR